MKLLDALWDASVISLGVIGIVAWFTNNVADGIFAIVLAVLINSRGLRVEGKQIKG